MLSDSKSSKSNIIEIGVAGTLAGWSSEGARRDGNMGVERKLQLALYLPLVTAKTMLQVRTQIVYTRLLSYKRQHVDVANYLITVVGNRQMSVGPLVGPQLGSSSSVPHRSQKSGYGT